MPFIKLSDGIPKHEIICLSFCWMDYFLVAVVDIDFMKNMIIPWRQRRDA